MKTKSSCQQRLVWALLLILLAIPSLQAEAQLFEPGVTYATGDYPLSSAVGDLNEDSRPDFVMANYFGTSISLFLGNGDGTFQSALTIETDERIWGIAVADLDLDSHLDVVVTNYQISSISVLLGNGNATFQSEVKYATGTGPYSVGIGYLNGDGNPDLAVVNGSNDNISILLGNGDGTFISAGTYGTDDYPSEITIADLNGDGHLDLTTANLYGHSVSVLLGNGDGTFQSSIHYGSGENPRNIAIADLDGDSFLDLATANFVSEDISILFGNGDGTFENAIICEETDAPTSIISGDFDLDSHSDLVVTNYNDNTISILLGNGNGTFQPTVAFAAGDRPGRITAGDLDADAALDLIVKNSEVDTATVFINRTEGFSGGPLLVIGPGPAYANSPLVRSFVPMQNANHVFEFRAYQPTHYGVNVATGSVDGEDTDRIITGAGPGDIYGPHVRGFEVNGTPLPGLSFLAYGTPKWGVNVSTGDIDDDGFDEIITGAGPGAVFGPHVRAFDYDDTASISPVSGVSYFAYGTPKWGVNVTSGDIDGDGFDEIITGAGPGSVYGPHVRGWNVDGGSVTAISGVSFFAYGTIKYGVNVTCGDIDGDNIDEIVTSPGPGVIFGAHIRGWNYDGQSLTSISECNFFAWSPDNRRYGAEVSSGLDVNGDGRDELFVGSGPDPTADTTLKVFSYSGTNTTTLFSLSAYPGYNQGINVAAGLF